MIIAKCDCQASGRGPSGPGPRRAPVPAVPDRSRVTHNGGWGNRFGYLLHYALFHIFNSITSRSIHGKKFSTQSAARGAAACGRFLQIYFFPQHKLPINSNPARIATTLIRNPIQMSFQPPLKYIPLHPAYSFVVINK